MSISYNVTPKGVEVIEAITLFGQQYLVVFVIVVASLFLCFLYFFFKYYGRDYL